MTYRIGPWTPENNDQHVESVNTCSCPYCNAKPGEWCVTKGGYIAQGEHVGRRQEWHRRTSGIGPPAPDWAPVIPAMARVVTIEVLLPRDTSIEQEAMVNKALRELRTTEGFAEITGSVHVAQTMEEASEILKLRSIEL